MKGMANMSKQWKMLKYLWNKVPSDCRFDVFMDFVLRPQELERKYHEETLFQDNINDKWKGNKDVE